MLAELLAAAQADQPLWMPELRRHFALEPSARPVILRLTRFDGTQLDYPCHIPLWENEAQRRFCADFLYACVYNILAANSGCQMLLFFDRADPELTALYDSLDSVFQLRRTKRDGYGKVINIAGRIAAGSGASAFHFAASDLAEYSPLQPAPESPASGLDAYLRSLSSAAGTLHLCGVDVGGSDIKLVVSAGDRLISAKEYDWNPAGCAEAKELLDPILLLTRLMRACLASTLSSVPQELQLKLTAALAKDASVQQMQNAVEETEACLGERIDVLDGIGVSFPDIVIEDRILGGETPKTNGLRLNASLDYEKEFRKLSELKTSLLRLCRRTGRVRLTNDGNMAAFSAAMELACSCEADRVRQGVVAHSLGTDLGTGWLLPDGSIPPLPLEMYDAVLDLGSFSSRAFSPEDLRSTRNANSGLSGARRYMGQSAAYRLAWQFKPALLADFTVRDGDLLTIAVKPEDLRKPCLEHLMSCAEAGDSAACDVFRHIGRNLAVVTEEMDYLLRPAARTRFLFGRFVKRPAVFDLLREGFESRIKDICLLPSNGEMARTPLMRQLAALPEMTVAQFGQAVGAVYFSLT